MTGIVELLAVAPLVAAPMQLVQQARALAGRGLEGDRYANGSGTFSPRGAHRPGYELTLIAAEVVEELTRATLRSTSPVPDATSSPAASTSTPSSGATSASATSTAAACVSPNPAPTSNGSKVPACCDRSSTAAAYAPTSSATAISPPATRSRPNDP